MSAGSQGRWLELRVRLSDAAHDGPPGSSASDELADALIALGGRAVEDRYGWLVTHLPEPPDPDAFISEVEPRLIRALGVPVTVAVGWCEAEDWAETWKRGLGPRRLTPRLWVTPSWEPADAGPGEVVVVVDPGMAFGTAEHGTTRGVLRLLDRALVAGDRVLDVGSGSAILAVAAALLGAGEVVAIEGDPIAGEYARENIERNGVASRVRWIEAWADAAMLPSFAPTDGITANIEGGVLRRLLAGFLEVLRPGGWLILSGIPAEEWELFSHDVIHSGFALEATDADGDWRSGWFTRSTPAPRNG
ncbi:MAG: methyltransferase domain-containing protein [Gemmatimonadetes bacterium]|nr:methyltransferase domain-containing protein [Gemmatimonadota bacterium]